jgi:hypothetical protein
MLAVMSRGERMLVLGSGLVLLASGCLIGSRRGYALYPPGRRLARSEVAAVMGYVKEIDGKDASKHGSSFELLPGCHQVGTPASWGSPDARSGATIINTGQQVFALPMKAGYSYVVEVGADGPSPGPIAPARLRAREVDPAGSTPREFAPVRGEEDIAACQREAGDCRSQAGFS